ncbi:hypothetical protein [Rhodococcus maanshanensis]|uniref:Uncharacterized protein n=1 Tax=Rhodococcus maanshanensis TaxID=183556 RepID=A0A1H7XR62_9NOCA|nr:hypothetical protein [Rhodococcus maanshanensis]SEM36145.1 hypothetical protein SAMN05444583_1346 [Rhodococcus maanshanensis]
MGGDLLLLVVTIGPLTLFGWAAIRAKHRGLGGAFVGPFQEMFDPGGARAQIVIEEMAELPDPSDSGDPDNDENVPYTVVYDGVRLYINQGKNRRRGGDRTTSRAE